MRGEGVKLRVADSGKGHGPGPRRRPGLQRDLGANPRRIALRQAEKPDRASAHWRMPSWVVLEDRLDETAA
jgi:hypothetical protein